MKQVSPPVYKNNNPKTMDIKFQMYFYKLPKICQKYCQVTHKFLM